MLADPSGAEAVVPLTTIREPDRTARADPALVKALARAFRYQSLLDEGLYASISEMAEGEKIERGYLGNLLRLTLLAPTLVEELVNGKTRCVAMLPELLQPLPQIWKHQLDLLVS